MVPISVIKTNIVVKKLFKMILNFVFFCSCKMYSNNDYFKPYVPGSQTNLTIALSFFSATDGYYQNYVMFFQSSGSF